MHLARHRAAVAAAFATQGFLFISLTTRLPDLKDRWALSEVEISMILLAIVLLAGAGSLLTERLAARRDSAVLLRGGLIVIGAGAGVMLGPDAAPLFLLGIGVYGIGLGVVDATTNMQAVAIEHAYARPILPSFHGAWTFGGLLGAGLTVATEGVALPAVASLGLVAVAAACLPFLARREVRIIEQVDGTEAATGDAPTASVPWRPILMVGLGMVVFHMVDTASQTWGAVYLDEIFDAPSRWVALATLPYLVASLVVRLAGDALVTRYGARPVLQTGAVLACGGLLLVTLAQSWPWAVVGFTVVGAGISVVAPLSFSAAASIAAGSDRSAGEPGGIAVDRRRVDAVIARFNQFNYVGGLLGAVLTGLVGAQQLRFGFCVPIVLVLTLIPLSRWFVAPGGNRREHPHVHAS